jgi:hypothetical protein
MSLDPIYKVFDDDNDLLREFLVHLFFPTSLICVALIW